ncbi:hypothetical protein CMI37_04065 [Candidatus Pacearchaeota archaeon]|nr:hypothetical protein [Candidatus Pacearchaeota archaeon]
MSLESEFHFMFDPFTGRIALMVPAPIVAFDDFESFEDFVEMVNDAADVLQRYPSGEFSVSYTNDEKKTIKRKTKIESNYAKEVIEAWQEQMIDSGSPEVGPKKPETKRGDSISQDKQ